MSFSSEARGIFLAWERLRLLYNAILIVGTLGVAVTTGGTGLLGRVSFWMDAVVGGVVANGCYFAGPIVESYLAWLGLRWDGFRR